MNYNNNHQEYDDEKKNVYQYNYTTDDRGRELARYSIDRQLHGSVGSDISSTFVGHSQLNALYPYGFNRNLIRQQFVDRPSRALLPVTSEENLTHSEASFVSNIRLNAEELSNERLFELYINDETLYTEWTRLMNSPLLRRRVDTLAAVSDLHNNFGERQVLYFDIRTAYQTEILNNQQINSSLVFNEDGNMFTRILDLPKESRQTQINLLRDVFMHPDLRVLFMGSQSQMDFYENLFRSGPMYPITSGLMETFPSAAIRMLYTTARVLVPNVARPFVTANLRNTNDGIISRWLSIMPQVPERFRIQFVPTDELTRRSSLFSSLFQNDSFIQEQIAHLATMAELYFEPTIDGNNDMHLRSTNSFNNSISNPNYFEYIGEMNNVAGLRENLEPGDNLNSSDSSSTNSPTDSGFSLMEVYECKTLSDYDSETDF